MIGGVAIGCFDRKHRIYSMDRGSWGGGREGMSAYIVQTASKEPCLACTSYRFNMLCIGKERSDG